MSLLAVTVRRMALALLCLSTAACLAQAPLKMTKVDPPNWYATMPRPMLLVQGEGLTGASFALSDPALRVDRTVFSANGHWAQLWLAASPDKPETVELTAKRGAAKASMAYTFAARRGDGVAGFNASDVLYLIVTDRFADGDPKNDGPLGKSAATSAEAAAERAKVRGWHGGDLRGIGQRLDFLQGLGVTAVWPTPVYQNHGPEAFHGYHTTDYYSVDEHYGSLDDLKKLSADLHARGMKLVLDTVPNHVGPFHPWIQDEPAADWFHGTLANHIEAEYRFKALIDPHSAERDRHPTRDGWFVNLLPDMNTESPAVKQYLTQNAAWWLEQTGADALRIDTFAFVDRQFWANYLGTLHALFPHLTEVGEVLDGDPQVTSFFAGDHAMTAGDGTIDTKLYTPFDFPGYFAVREALSGKKPMTAIGDVLRGDELYPHPERLVTLIGNHDQARVLSVPGMDVARLKLAFGLLGTMRGMPHLYYGDELAMAGGEDPDNRKDLPPAAFTKAGRTPEQQAMYAWVASVMQLRAKAPALQSGYQETLLEDASTFAFLRGTGTGDCTASASERYVVIVNNAAEMKTEVIKPAGTRVAGCSRYESLLGTGATAQAVPAGIEIKLPAHAIGVFRVQR